VNWTRPKASYIFIFGVGRGNATFIRSGLNHGLIVDVGSSEDFSPLDFVERHLLGMLTKHSISDKSTPKNIAQLVLSHPHNDHLSELDRVKSETTDKPVPFDPALLTCPHHKESTDGMPDEALNWARIKNPGGSERLVELYKSLYVSRKLPLQTIVHNQPEDMPGLEYGIYYVRPPLCEELHPSEDHKYGNATSLVFYYRHGKQSILLPGDITPEAIKYVLYDKDGTEKRYTIFDKHSSERNPDWHMKTSDQPSLSSRLGRLGLTVLVAPHHGLESCYSPELYDAMKGGMPSLVVLSEKRKRGEHDGATDVHYTSANGAAGLEVNVEGQRLMKRYISTSNGSNLLIVFHGSDDPPKVYVNRDPVKLLEYI
jgi:hypothetical protein